MTPPAKPDLAATLARLRERFLSTSGDIVRGYESLAARLTADPADGEALQELRQSAHRTHGTAGSYGFHGASRMASSLELLAIDWLADPQRDTARRAAIVAGFASLLPSVLGEQPARRLLLVDLPDDRSRALAAECLVRGIVPERVAASTISAPSGDQGAVAAVAMAGSDVPLLAALEANGATVVRLAPGEDAVSAASACFGSSP